MRCCPPPTEKVTLAPCHAHEPPLTEPCPPTESSICPVDEEPGQASGGEAGSAASSAVPASCRRPTPRLRMTSPAPIRLSIKLSVTMNCTFLRRAVCTLSPSGGLPARRIRCQRVGPLSEEAELQEKRRSPDPREPPSGPPAHANNPAIPWPVIPGEGRTPTGRTEALTLALSSEEQMGAAGVQLWIKKCANRPGRPRRFRGESTRLQEHIVNASYAH